MADLYLSDVEDTTLKLSVSDWRGVLDPAELEYATVAIPGIEGEVIESDEPTVKSRSIRVQATIEDTNPATLETAVRVFNRWANFNDLLGIRTAHDLTKVVYGRLVSSPFENYPHQMVQPLIKVDLSLLCHDPLWYAVTPTALSFSSATEVPLGNWRVRKGVVRLTGVQNTPTVSVTDWNGVAVSSFTINASLAGGSDYFEVDGGRGTVVKSVSGTITDAIEAFTGAFPVFDIRKAKSDFSVWPKIARTAVSGTPSGLLTYAPTWR